VILFGPQHRKVGRRIEMRQELGLFAGDAIVQHADHLRRHRPIGLPVGGDGVGGPAFGMLFETRIEFERFPAEPFAGRLDQRIGVIAQPRVDDTILELKMPHQRAGEGPADLREAFAQRRLGRGADGVERFDGGLQGFLVEEQPFYRGHAILLLPVRSDQSLCYRRLRRLRTARQQPSGTARERT